jgi:hypothetical protein
MNFDELKHDLRILAQAQEEFLLQGWARIKSVQRQEKSNSTAYGVLYAKGDKEFFLNLTTASKALKMLN